MSPSGAVLLLRFCVWLVLNCLYFRPLFGMLNTYGFEDWHCRPRSVSGGTGNSRTAANDTGLQVIVASLPYSGTTSMHHVMSTMGIRFYSVEEFFFYAPELVATYVSADALVSMLNTCVVKGVNVEPHMDLTAKLLAVSPFAKVIITAKSYSGWLKSKRSNLDNAVWQREFLALMGCGLCNWLPYSAFGWPSQERMKPFTPVSLTNLLINSCMKQPVVEKAAQLSLDIMGNYNHAPAFWERRHQITAENRPRPSLLSFLGTSSEPADGNVTESEFYAYYESIRKLVPPERLMEFDFKKHTWADLSAFLGRPAPSDAIGLLPRFKAGGSNKAIVRYRLYPVTTFIFWSLMVSTIAINWIVFSAVAAFCWKVQSQTLRWLQRAQRCKLD
eukprot:gnl/TRDRNA2_/TRDRNA2_74313_c0_seq1.p1 gnl/TRDRNA2_/TRDRNA2_74313_c0~~gnl/TRDRNA2_/TRDRNA2_74313_c0_seq1.p1  ORF type:complete len:387 (+),score=28.08 gnl/TRDRNA2_/TRDRNA2_74313_c0_seq1:107-1267(+)